MIVRFDEILDNLLGMLTSFGGIWNYINLPLTELNDPDTAVGIVIDAWYDAFLNLLGIGQYGLIHFIIGGGLVLTIFLVVISFFQKVAIVFKLVG